MELILFCVFLGISLLTICIGLFRPEHTEMALIGFVFLFLLAINLEAGGVDYKIGTITNSTFSYTDFGNYTLLTSSDEVNTDVYSNFTGGTMSHIVGYWLAIMAVIGFVGVLVGLRRQRMD